MQFSFKAASGHIEVDPVKIVFNNSYPVRAYFSNIPVPTLLARIYVAHRPRLEQILHVASHLNLNLLCR
jgi:hypothetical protein